jgi:putative hydrolase of the HAD superfamily
MKAILIFDADNTLWDTDSVFRNAQLSLLKTLEKFQLLTRPEEQLTILRMIDRELFEQMGRFEYDFKVLTTAITYYFAYKLTLEDIKNVVCHAISDLRKNVGNNSHLNAVIAAAYHAYSQGLIAIPELYPDTENTLRHFSMFKKSHKVLGIILLSEGDSKRLNRILECYNGLKQCFDKIFIEVEKNKETIEKVKEIAKKQFLPVETSQEILFILIGDSLKRDVKLGNQTGFITIYKPSPFMGEEKPLSLDEQPHHTVQKLGELPYLFKSLGLSIEV